MGRPGHAKTGVEAGPEMGRKPPDDRQFELEHMLMEADRMMMQIVNLALSLIGFGFSINAFFNDAASRAARSDHHARMFGIFLVALGLVFLVMGTWNQAAYRRQLMVRFGAPSGFRAVLDGHATPPFVTAFLLMTAGVGALGLMLFRRFL